MQGYTRIYITILRMLLLSPQKNKSKNIFAGKNKVVLLCINN